MMGVRRFAPLCAVLAALAVGLTRADRALVAQGRGAAPAPAYQVVPLWPEPLPNHWVLGSVTGVAVDAQNHVWVTHRGADSLGNNEKGMMLTPPTSSVCCIAAPFVLEFDAGGKLLSYWGGPGAGYDWPQTPAAITVDAKGNVWIAAAGNPPAPAGRGRGARGAAPPPPRPADAHVLKFTRAGQFLLQIGKAGDTSGGNGSTTTLNRPAGLAVDVAANEVYVADGFGNRRIVVFDAETGAYKRHWGAYGGRPDEADPGPYDPGAPPAKQFRDVTCVELSRDGLVYVCDRRNNRIQVFRKDGTFVKEGIVSTTTLGNGAVWDLAFSNDPQQRYVFVADGQDKKVLILERESLKRIGSFGDGGRQPGRFLGVGSISVDSRGTIYTGEHLEGKRVQKWIPVKK